MPTFRYTEELYAVQGAFLDEITTEAAIGLKMGAEDGHKFWLGPLNLTATMARRKVAISGSMGKALKLLSAMKPAFPRYKVFLEANGHQDKL